MIITAPTATVIRFVILHLPLIDLHGTPAVDAPPCSDVFSSRRRHGGVSGSVKSRVSGAASGAAALC
jgi:hypothetical protein